MADPADLLVGIDESPQDRTDSAPLREAVIDSTPETIDEPVWVVVPSFSDQLRFGPCPWEPRITSDSTYGTPEKGDRCLVAISDELEAWVVGWWPYS